MSVGRIKFGQLARSEIPYLRNCQAYIGGKWRNANDRTTFAVLNPASGKEIAQVANCGKVDAEEAVFEASRSFSVWRKKTAQERCSLLHKWKNLLVYHKDDIAKIMTLEQGKVLAEAEGEVAYAASYIEWFAEEGKRVYGDYLPPPIPSQRGVVINQPIGVAALWTPWNFPLAMLARKAAPALAAGCTVVCKPSEETPLTAMALAQLAEEAGIPEGVLNLLPCSRENVDEVTDVIMDNGMVTKFSFTGSTNVGKILLRKCANTVKKVTVELGGNAAFIVFNSADVDAAVAGAIHAKFRNSGQTCNAVNRLLVQDEIHDVFVAKFVEAMKKIVIGNGLESETTHGPLINDKAVEKVEENIKKSVNQGAKIVCGGKKDKLGGRFFEPTVLSDVTSDMAVSYDENFGPVAPIIKFTSEDEAIAMANATPYGLAGYFYSQDHRQMWRVAEALDVGMVGVNSGAISSVIAPFGGVKESGLGREGSKYGIEEYLEKKLVMFDGV